MLPNELASVYRQYKKDIDSVAAWLASTAKACGFPEDQLTSKSWDSDRPKAGRLKGKERKLAKAQAAAGIKPTRYVVAVKDFVPLAQFIAGCTKPVVAVPDVFSRALDRLIKLRAEYGRMRAYNVDDPESKFHREKHGVLGSLLGVRDSLSPRMSTCKHVHAAAAHESAQDIADKFYNLVVDDEPGQTFLDGFALMSRERPGARPGDRVTYTAEELSSFTEALFALAILINDLGKIRSRVAWIWRQHLDGEFELGAAAVATDAAVSLGRGLIDEVEPVLNSQKGGAFTLVTVFWRLVCLDRGVPEDQVLHRDKDKYFNYDLYEVADEVYLVSFMLLSTFAKMLHPRDIPMIDPNEWGRYRPKSDRTTKSGSEKLEEDRLILLEVFMEVITIIRLLPAYPVQDEFVRGMRELEKTKRVPFSLVFAAQMFLDINHIMREATRRSFSTMVSQVTRMSEEIKFLVQFHSKLKNENWTLENEHKLTSLQNVMKWVGTDPVYQTQVRSRLALGMNVSGNMKVHRALKRSPVLCGLYLYRMRYEMYSVGIDVTNAWGSITYAAHLYNALLNEKLLESLWPDMEIAINLLSGSTLWFNGERPSTYKGYFEKFCIRMGVTRSAFTSKRRPNIALGSCVRPQEIQDGAPISFMFKPEMIREAESGICWTKELIDAVMSRCRGEEEEVAEKCQRMATQTDGQLAKNTKEGKAGTKSKEKSTVARPDFVDPSELIKALLFALGSESLELAFPYPLMHRFSWKILRATQVLCDDLLRKKYSQTYIEREDQLPWVVGYILMAASGANGDAQDLGPLKEAAIAFNSAIKKNGRVSIKGVKKIGFEIDLEDKDESQKDLNTELEGGSVSHGGVS